MVLYQTLAAAVFMAILSNVIIDHSSSILHPPPIESSRDVLNASKVIPLPGAHGPESLVFDPNGGGPYTGVADGRILKWSNGNWVDFATTSSNRTACTQAFHPPMEHICGRPLGLRFEKKTGDLYIADAYFGINVVGGGGGLATKLVTEVENRPLLFTNDMDIDEDDDVLYFSDSSEYFHRRNFMDSVLSLDASGKLMKYDKKTKEVTVLLRGLAFANGVALGKDKSFVLVVETATCRIIKYWLKGQKAGSSEVLVKLPGYPDNIRRNEEGDFWVALHCRTGGLFSRVYPQHSLIGKTLLKLPIGFPKLHSWLVGGNPHATVVKIDENGRILDVLEDFYGKTIRYVSEVEEKDGNLWVGSVMVPFVGVYKL